MNKKEFEQRMTKLTKESRELESIKPMNTFEKVALETMKEQLEKEYKQLVEYEISQGW
jgi:hypothetical protein